MSKMHLIWKGMLLTVLNNILEMRGKISTCLVDVASWDMYRIKLFHMHSSSWYIPEGLKDTVHCSHGFLKCQGLSWIAAWNNTEMQGCVSKGLSTVLIMSCEKRMVRRKFLISLIFLDFRNQHVHTACSWHGTVSSHESSQRANKGKNAQ